MKALLYPILSLTLLSIPQPSLSQDVQVVTGQCTAQSHIAEGNIGDDLTKRHSRFYCDSAVITFLDNDDKHIIIHFAETKSHHEAQLGFAGVMEDDGQVMDVQRIYLQSDKPTPATAGNCKFFFENRHMSSIYCGAKIDENGRRTVASVEFNASPRQ